MPRFPGYGHANRFQPDFYGDNQAYHQFRDHPSFQSSLSRQPVSNRPLHHHLHESDPGYVDLRCVPAWDCSHLRSQSGSGTRQQEQLSGATVGEQVMPDAVTPARSLKLSAWCVALHAGVCQLSDAGSPRRLRPLSRRIVIEDGDDFPVAGYARVPLAVAREARTAASMQQSHAQAASQRSHAESDDDQDDGDEAGDLDSEQQRLQQLQHRQQLQEHLLRQRRLQVSCSTKAFILCHLLHPDKFVELLLHAMATCVIMVPDIHFDYNDTDHLHLCWHDLNLCDQAQSSKSAKCDCPAARVAGGARAQACPAEGSTAAAEVPNGAQLGIRAAHAGRARATPV